MLEPHRGTVVFFILLTIVLFHFFFLCVCHLAVIFLGASLVCVNNLKGTADLVLWFPDRTAVCTHSWPLYNLIVLKASLNPTKLKQIFLNVSTIKINTWLVIYNIKREYISISLLTVSEVRQANTSGNSTKVQWNKSEPVIKGSVLVVEPNESEYDARFDQHVFYKLSKSTWFCGLSFYNWLTLNFTKIYN